ncbi:MORC family CW-type zinc finger protein 3 isoform X2 [Nothobranchius furzeri]|uniref:MORC family CW-type zinc finger protein 3 isoform X2 n=1 Tax=Nothobranchius furzeri TaxID=105023 RepID=UPI00077D3046|nr:MORC family CW-type zinc finger protein 3a isoform X2 [Nothobranchius furzeri]
MAALPDRGVPLSTLSPKFLHTNSTSHTWPFSAIAELIDNAYDPDVSAKQFWIDKTIVNEKLCLTFVDNGNGLNHETLHKMLSFGYSDKVAVNGLEPIGIYGNGFKSGAMRLGKDAIVFSRSSSTSCVGMLSQSYLETIKANQIIVPIVCFEKKNSDQFSVRKEHEASLRDILRYSLFNTKEELLAEIDAIHMPGSQQETGTRIIIWNLRRTSTGEPEFDFDKDRYDIQIPSEIYETMQDPSQHPNRLNSYIPKSVYSLRAYCSILYLKPRMQVMVRGHKVKSELVAKSLAYVRKDHYKPSFVKKRIPITFGYNTKSKDQYGIMMYHKNRLIKAYERVGCQLKANNIGVGVIGVIECNFLDPTHNKQSFIESDKYRKTMMNLGIKLEEYWQEIRYRRKKDNPNDTVPVEDTMKRPDQNWAQCDDCLRWRKLPDGIDCSKLPDKWFCKMNPDPQFRSCLVEEEPEDSDDDQPSYRKTYKQQEREDRKKQEQKIQLELKHLEERRLKSLKKQGEALGRQHENLSPSTPSTSRSRLQRGGAVKAESSPTPTSSHTGSPVTPYRNTGLPVITNVCSLSVEAQRGKRPQPVTPQGTPKRPRKNGFCQNASTGDLSWRSSSVPVDVDDDADDDTDDTDDDDNDDDNDEIVIVETSSTPKPQKPAPSIAKIKKEEEAASELATSMLLECTDDAAVDFSSEDTAAGPSTQVINSSTQTAASKVKLETESQSQPGGREKGCSNNGAMSDNTDTPVLQQQTLKQENGESSQSGNRGEQSLSNGVTHMENDEIAEPSYAPLFADISVVQKQQDQLLELMQDTAQERDSLKEEVQRLNTQLQERVSVKSECSHQACQTEVQKDYRSLFEKAKKKVHDLVKDKEFLSNAADISTGANAAPGEEPDVQEISLQVGGLVRELDQRQKKMDELRSKLVSLEEEKSALAAQCEELRSSLQQERETAQSEEAGGSAGSGSTSEDHESLIRLRKNVGRLLVSYIPDLDLEQVNYDCTVIDEILEQYVNDGCDAAIPLFS